MIGFLGLGVMGMSMALNLIRSGTDLVVWNCSVGGNDTTCGGLTICSAIQLHDQLINQSRYESDIAAPIEHHLLTRPQNAIVRPLSDEGNPGDDSQPLVITRHTVELVRVEQDPLSGTGAPC